MANTLLIALKFILRMGLKGRQARLIRGLCIFNVEVVNEVTGSDLVRVTSLEFRVTSWSCVASNVKQTVSLRRVGCHPRSQTNSLLYKLGHLTKPCRAV